MSAILFFEKCDERFVINKPKSLIIQNFIKIVKQPLFITFVQVYFFPTVRRYDDCHDMIPASKIHIFAMHIDLSRQKLHSMYGSKCGFSQAFVKHVRTHIHIYGCVTDFNDLTKSYARLCFDNNNHSVSSVHAQQHVVFKLNRYIIMLVKF